MADTKSTTVTNIDANPPVKTGPGKMHGRMHVCQETLDVAAADSDNDVFRFFRVHSSWVPVHLWLYNDAITSGSDYDFGLHGIEAGAAVDANLFGDAVAMTSGRTTSPLDLMYEAINITSVGKPIWELLGLSADPGLWYDLTATGITIGSGAGDITLVFEYVAGD